MCVCVHVGRSVCILGYPQAVLAFDVVYYVRYPHYSRAFWCLHREEVDDMAKRLKVKLFRTSVKENFNVDQGMYNDDLLAIMLLLLSQIVYNSVWVSGCKVPGTKSERGHTNSSEKSDNVHRWDQLPTCQCINKHCCIMLGGGIFTNDDNKTSPRHSSNAQNTGSKEEQNGGQSFQIKPSKQRAKKKKMSNCVVLWRLAAILSYTRTHTCTCTKD